MNISSGLKDSTAQDLRSLAVSASPWPDLASIGLSVPERLARRSAIGGSDANIILSDDAERVLRLWREKRGELEPEDLSCKLNVAIGNWTEEFNRQWYQQQTGLVVEDAGLIAQCGERAWRRATLDGIVPEKSSIWEAKHVNAFAKSEEVLARYMPQLQHNMAVVGLENAILSVIYGNHKWEIYEIASDWLYQDDLLFMEERFWACVAEGRPPINEAAPPPPRPKAYREISFEGNNLWATAATDWLENREAAQRHAGATKTLKELVEADVTRGFGHGVEAKRSKAGAISIREIA